MWLSELGCSLDTELEWFTRVCKYMESRIVQGCFLFEVLCGCFCMWLLNILFLCFYVCLGVGCFLEGGGEFGDYKISRTAQPLTTQRRFSKMGR